ncbi:MAG TPA: L-seryl-tRNA(Sec) selenium transferase, partial [Planctomycetota bacterium]|nr:L-seryl-tRNA(Sec) selenium transferase [Planctomycetota bacterium]
MPHELLRRLPPIDRVLSEPRARELLERHPRGQVVRAIRSVIDELREQIRSGAFADGTSSAAAIDPEAIAARASRRIAESDRPLYPRAINATGIILHTGLGRAVIAERAWRALAERVRGPVVVEIDRDSGERNEREAALRPLIEELTGAESATVVNNNAAATLLVLATLASGREVVISRGELVEIGGSFRIPEILAASGARLVEVGTTNRTYIADYARAIGPETGLLLQVHPSNYEIRGFTAKPALRDIVALGRERGIPVVSDLGSGAWIDVEPFGFRREPLVRDVVAAGPDLVAFSGDKLLGGPQAGLILGREEAVRRVRAHPLFRCLRVDKMTLVLLEETLRLYRDPPRAIDELPALRALAAPIEEVIARAKRLEVRVNELRPMDASKLEIEIIATTAE